MTREEFAIFMIGMMIGAYGLFTIQFICDILKFRKKRKESDRKWELEERARLRSYKRAPGEYMMCPACEGIITRDEYILGAGTQRLACGHYNVVWQKIIIPEGL